MIRHWLPRVVLAAVGLLLLAQVVPYGRSHANPAPTREARFPTASGQKLFMGACGDCHSDRTTWPWYTNVAPVSWLVKNDVDGGRGSLDVSRWDRPQPDVAEVVDQILGGEMPPLQYKIIHSSGRLSDGERARLAAEMKRLYATDPPASTRAGGG